MSTLSRGESTVLEVLKKRPGPKSITELSTELGLTQAYVGKVIQQLRNKRKVILGPGRGGPGTGVRRTRDYLPSKRA